MAAILLEESQDNGWEEGELREASKNLDLKGKTHKYPKKVSEDSVAVMNAQGDLTDVPREV